jgi:hypothetical protein
MALALPHFSFRNLDAFAQASPTLERPKVGKSLLLPIHGILAMMGNVRHPCRTRVSNIYLTQGPRKLKAEGIFAESFKKT